MSGIHLEKIAEDFEIYQIFYFILAVLGVYLIYSVWKMKTKGEISSLIIDAKDLAKCRNKKGFIEKTAKALLLLGIVSLLEGIFGIINSLIFSFGWPFELLGISVFLISYGWFSKELRAGIETYCK